MPSEIVSFLPRPEVLTFEEIGHLTNLFSQLGIRKIRLTGGEPLVRREIPKLIQQLSEIPGIEQLAMTTNAILLSGLAGELKRAGLQRLNISLDSLDRQQFKNLTRRDQLPDVLQGIAAARQAGFEDIRLNAVAVRGLIESQIIPLAEFALENELQLRFIEFMPLNAAGAWEDNDVLSGEAIREIISGQLGELTPVEREDPSQPASDYRLKWTSSSQTNAAPRETTIGFINSVTEPFCAQCNRLRLTADGKLRNCLFSHEEWNLRDPLRSGATDTELVQIIQDCVRNKKAAHGIGQADFAKPERAMYQIGG